MEKIKGLIDAPFTPMKENGDINYGIVPAYAQMLSRTGMVGVFINGSSGEGHLLSVEERKRLAEAWMAAVPEGFKVIVHVGSSCLRDSQVLADHAAKIGAWGISSMAPPYPKVGRVEELADYCEAVAGAAPGLPFYFYHIPSLNGTYLPMLDFLKAVDGRIPNFAGIKYTHQDIFDYCQCMYYKDGKYDMLHGHDETQLSSLVMGGARGCICGTTNFNGREHILLHKCWYEGDIEGAREHQKFSQAVINIICRYSGGNIVAGKRIMKLIGLDLGPNRTPYRNMTASEEAEMKALLEEIGFFGKCNIV